MTPLQLIDAYITWLRVNRGRAENTAILYRRVLELLLAFLQDRDPSEASDDDLVLFTGQWIHKRGVAANGRRPYVAAVRGFYRWLVANGHAKRNPAAALEYPSVGRRMPRVMTLASLEKLMWAPDYETFEGVRDGALLALFAGCGVRVSGLVKLNVRDVLEQVVDGRPRLFIRVKEKGAKERAVPVPPEADLQLRVYLEHPELKEVDRALDDGDQVLFVTRMNRRCPPHLYHGERRRISRGAVQKMIVTYGKRKGIPPEQLHPHALRHLFGTELTESDVSVLVVQQLMGHADPKSTQVYTHLAVRKLMKQSDLANPLAKIRTPVSDLLHSMQAAGKPASTKKSTTTR